MSGTVPKTIPASFLDYTMVTGIDEVGKGVAQMGATISFGTRLDEARLTKALRLLLDAEPVLGCSLDLRVGVWRRLPPNDLDDALGIAESQDPSSTAIAFVAAPLDPAHGPQARAILLRSAERDTLVLKATHAAVDSQAVLDAVGLIGRFYRELTADPAWTSTVNADGVRDFRPVNRGIGMTAKLRVMTSSDTKDPPSDWHINYQFHRGAETYAFASVEPAAFRTLKTLGRERGATVNDLLISALYRSLWRLLGARPGDKTPLMATADLRGAFPPGTPLALANLSVPWWVKVSPIADEDFDGTLARVLESTAEWKRGEPVRAAAVGMGSVEGWMHGLRGKALRRMLRGGIERAKAEVRANAGRMTPVLSNVGVIAEDGVDFGPEAPIEHVWFFGPIGLGPWIGLSASTFRNRLELSTGFDAEALDADVMRGIVVGAAEELEQYAGDARELT